MRLIVILIVAIGLSGCATLPSKYSPPKLIPQPIENADVIGLITAGKESGTEPGLTEGQFRERFERSLRDANVTRIERNRIQDRLLMASNVLCEQYKTDLKHTQSGVNFRLGVAAVTAGALGAVSAGAQAAKNLSALAGGLTGVRAEFNEDYFSQLAAHVISRGITARRDNILGKIQASRDSEPAEYTLEAALGDAVTYHGACTLIGGLEQAESAVNRATINDPGLDALFSTIAKSRGAAPAASPAASAPTN